jgi:hypothetical protein
MQNKPWTTRKEDEATIIIVLSLFIGAVMLAYLPFLLLGLATK